METVFASTDSVPTRLALTIASVRLATYRMKIRRVVSVRLLLNRLVFSFYYDSLS